MADYTKPARQPGVYWVKYYGPNGYTVIRHIAQYCKMYYGDHADLYAWCFLGHTKTQLDSFILEVGPKIQEVPEWLNDPLNVTTHFPCGCDVIVYDPKLNKFAEIIRPGAACNHGVSDLIEKAADGYERSKDRQRTHS